MHLLAFTLLLAQPEPITASQLREALSSTPRDDAALAARLRASFPAGTDPKKGPHAPLIDKEAVAFVLEARANAKPRVEGVMNRGRGWELTRLGDTGLWAAAERVPPDAKFAYRLVAGTRTLAEGVVAMAGWSPPAEAKARPEVAYGEYSPLEFRSKTFDRPCNGWIYVPAAIEGMGGPIGLTVFLDGDAYRREGVATVVENLIVDRAIPPMVAVGLNPGRLDDGRPGRYFEYEVADDRFARFLAEEVLPRVQTQPSPSPKAVHRAIVGASSAGRCAFDVAWRHPELFGRACAQLGRFAETPGALSFAELVRQSGRKPLRKVVLSGGPDDGIDASDWWRADRELADALRGKEYDVDLIRVDGFHNLWTCIGHLPEALRRTWAIRDGD